MITIIKDYYDIVRQVPDNCIVVRDTSDYIQTRILLENVNLENDEIDSLFIIKNDKFDKGYIDIELLDTYVYTKIIDIKTELENKLSLDLSSVSSNDIIGVNVQKKLDEFVNTYDKGLSFYHNCIAYYFNIESIDVLHNLDGSIGFIIDNVPIIKNLKKEGNKVLEWVKNEIERYNHIDKEYRWIVDVFNINSSIDDYMESLLFNNIFKNYRKSDKMSIMQFPDQYNIKTELSKSQIITLIKNYRSFWRKLDDLVNLKKNQISLFDDNKDILFIIQGSSGATFSEYNHLLKLIFDMDDTELSSCIDEIMSYVDILLNKFAILRSVDKEAKAKGDTLVRFIDKLDKCNHFKWNFKDIEAWKMFYVNDYMTIYDNLDVEDNIFSLLDEIDIHNTDKQKIKKDLIKKKNDINTSYEDFLIKNYPEILFNSKTTANAMLGALEYIENEKLIIFVVDAMRWDLWKVLKEIFSNYGYDQVNVDDDIAILSLIPSVTSVSRLALFACNNYKNIVYNKQKQLYSFDFKDEYNHIKNYFKDKDVLYSVGGTKEFNSMIKNDSDIYVYVYSDADEIIHGLKDLNRSIMYSIFDLQIKNMISSIEKNISQNVQIIVATDHGTIDITNSEEISKSSIPTAFLDEHGILYSIHHKYIKIYAQKDVDCRVYNEIAEYFEQSNKWHIIDRDRMEKYGLPIVEGDRNILFYIISKYGYYINTGGRHGRNMHGGLSLNETIIPFAILRKSEDIEWQKLMIDIEGKLLNEKSSKITMTLYNPNNYSIEDIRVKMDPIYFDRYIDLIPAKGKRIFNVNVIPEAVGKIENIITIKYRGYGKRLQEEHKTHLTVEENIKTRISKSVNKARSLEL